MGSCANGGGYYHYSYAVVRGCDRIVPVSSMNRLSLLSLFKPLGFLAGGYIRTRLPSHSWSAHLWYASASKENCQTNPSLGLVAPLKQLFFQSCADVVIHYSFCYTWIIFLTYVIHQSNKSVSGKIVAGLFSEAYFTRHFILENF